MGEIPQDPTAVSLNLLLQQKQKHLRNKHTRNKLILLSSMNPH